MSPDATGPSPGCRTYAPSGALGADAPVASDLGGPSRLLRVGVAGDVRVKCSDGTTTTIYAVQIGEPIPLQVVALLASGTTAQQITLFK